MLDTVILYTDDGAATAEWLDSVWSERDTALCSLGEGAAQLQFGAHLLTAGVLTPGSTPYVEPMMSALAKAKQRILFLSVAVPLPEQATRNGVSFFRLSGDEAADRRDVTELMGYVVGRSLLAAKLGVAQDLNKLLAASKSDPSAPAPVAQPRAVSAPDPRLAEPVVRRAKPERAPRPVRTPEIVVVDEPNPNAQRNFRAAGYGVGITLGVAFAVLAGGLWWVISTNSPLAARPAPAPAIVLQPPDAASEPIADAPIATPAPRRAPQQAPAAAPPEPAPEIRGATPVEELATPAPVEEPAAAPPATPQP